MMLDELRFRDHAEETLDSLFSALERASDDYEFEVDRNGEAVLVEFIEPPAKFVVSPNAPVRQIWVSARVKSFKLDWNEPRSTFTLVDGRDLPQLMADVIGEQLGQPVSLNL
jgi:frataxin